jgi:hypothetical protein
VSNFNPDDYTEDEKAEIAAFLENFAKMLEGKAETCLRCNQPIDKLEQLGRSVYARPCGCRQYQGKVPKKDK